VQVRRKPRRRARACGAPRDPGNLWPEPHYGTKTAYIKDGVETKLKKAIDLWGATDHPGLLVTLQLAVRQ
jgi:hypothetical protein